MQIFAAGAGGEPILVLGLVFFDYHEVLSQQDLVVAQVDGLFQATGQGDLNHRRDAFH